MFFDNIHTSVWLSALTLIYLCLTLWAAVHVILHKQVAASAIAWLGIILLSPGIGVVLYWLLGINRIKRRAMREFSATQSTLADTDTSVEQFPQLTNQLASMMRAGCSIHQEAYVGGNTVQPLLNGNLAYPAMLESIEHASHFVVMSSYIFDYDTIGKKFIETLGRAHDRGVQIRVMIDGIGIGYSFSWTKTDFALRMRGIATARFLPTLSRRGTRFINLRNHRKILSVDGQEAFLGGINVRDNNAVGDVDLPVHKQTRDVHFKIRGPVINQINSLFADDWQFACGEVLDLPQWNGPDAGSSVCRVLPDGPDENYHKLQLTLTNAINSAASSIRIVTPYFLPDAILQRALELASRRGVVVEVIVPERSNIRVVDWALEAQSQSLIDAGVILLQSPAPFDHSKLFMVDESWCLIGSSNWDARSLELNFEVNLECYDYNLNNELQKIFKTKQATAKIRTKESLLEHSLFRKLRNNFFKLFLPYL